MRPASRPSRRQATRYRSIGSCMTWPSARRTRNLGVRYPESWYSPSSSVPLASRRTGSSATAVGGLTSSPVRIVIQLTSALPGAEDPGRTGKEGRPVSGRPSSSPVQRQAVVIDAVPLSTLSDQSLSSPPQPPQPPSPPSPAVAVAVPDVTVISLSITLP